MKNKELTKYIFGGLCFVAFLAVVIWLVRSEGERTRQAVREGAVEAGKEVREGIVEGAERAVDKAAEVPGKVLRDVRGELGEGAKQAGEVLQDVKDVLSSDSSDSETAENTKKDAPDVEPPKDNASDSTEGVKIPRSPSEAVREVFKLGHRMTRSVDDIGQTLLRLSVEEEKTLGRDVHRLICENHKILNSPELIASLERLAAPMLERRERKQITYTFSVLDDQTVNAFAHVGGCVYATKGLLDFAGSDAVQFVLGHEIAHVDMKHCTERITYAARAAEAAGQAGSTIAQLVYQVIAMGYYEEHEFEADKWSYQAMRRIGRSRDQALAFHRRYLEHVTERGLESPSSDTKNVFETTVQEVNNHFRTHPPMAERLRRLEALAED